jgi:opacity protein-like surface antigen
LVTRPPHVLAQRAPTAPPVEVRPFVLVEGERFTAATTFDATLGSSRQAIWGGGVEFTTRRRLFVDVAVSHMSATGQRAFVNNGQVFPLGIPLHASLTPVELTAGYRFRLLNRRRQPRRITPYVGAGIGWYLYHETSDFAASGEDVDTAHVGFVALGGAEFRVAKWIGIAGDAQFTSVPGILGQSGVSQQVNESDLGGIAARVRVILGR